MRGPNRDSFRTNYIITAIWALAFAVMVEAEFALLYFLPKQLGIDVTVPAIYGAIQFTTWYPETLPGKATRHP